MEQQWLAEDDDLDHQRGAMYTAEYAAREIVGPLPPVVSLAELVEGETNDLADFAKAAMRGAGWTGDLPKLTFIRDQDLDVDLIGAYYPASRTIYLELSEEGVSPFTVLHELAHWLSHTHRDGHGPAFCGAYVGLVRAALGPDVADVLLAEFGRHGVTVDESALDGRKRWRSQQGISRAQATHHRTRWTDPEIRVALGNGLTASDAAHALGRTVAAVKAIRRRYELQQRGS